MYLAAQHQEPRPGGAFHVPFEPVRAALDSQPWSGGTRRVVTALMPDDTAWNSASTKHVCHGPATVTWFEYPDGGIETVVSA